MTVPPDRGAPLPLVPLVPLVPPHGAPPATGAAGALVMPDGTLTRGELAAQVAATQSALDVRLHELVGTSAAPGDGAATVDPTAHPLLVAVPSVPRIGTVVALLAALGAGAAVVPVNVGAGPDEIDHVVRDSAPDLVLVPTGTDLPAALAGLPRLDVGAAPVPPAPTDVHHTPGTPHTPEAVPTRPPPDVDAPALVVYTSGTTGPPKGVVLSHGALAADLDALAAAWQLVPADVLVHALPLFHVHGLVLATLGPLRVGATVRHLGRFDAAAVGEQFRSGATVMYGVPTMYHRLADALETAPELARAIATARLLVSGSAGLAAHDRDRITRATGRPVLERYGMTETLITCAMTVDGAGEPGSVGPPLPGIELRLVDDGGGDIGPTDLDTVGEILVRGPTLFSGYLGRPDATAACSTPDGWFRTGDLATWSPTGAVRISGRRSVDLIKSGGYRIGAGEIENVLLTHPDVAEVAVTGEPDPDLGERIVAWVVPVPDTPRSADALVAHVSSHLAAHKRPRVVRFVDHLPRNELGKVLKRSLTTGDPPPPDHPRPS